MARKTCAMPTRYALRLVSAVFAAFLIRSNESLIAGKRRCRAVLGLGSQSDMNNCLRTAFPRTYRSSSIILGISSESDTSSSSLDSENERSVMFFADIDADVSNDRNDVDQVVTEKDDISNVHSEKGNTIEKSQKGSLKEKGGENIMVKETKGNDEERVEEEQRQLQFRELREKTYESVENVFKPLTQIKEGVPAERIKGAAIAATALTFLASKGIIASSAVGLSAAYISISKSVAGDLLRTVGGATWEATETTSKIADQLGIIPRFGEVDRTVVNKYNQNESTTTGSEGDEGELDFIEAEGDDDLYRVLKEAESVIGEADAAIAKAETETEQKEKVKRSIEEELRKIAEEARIKEQEETADEIMYRNEEEDKSKIVDENRIVEKAKLETEEEEEDIFVDDEQIIKNVDVKVSDKELEEDDNVSFDDDLFLTAVESAQEKVEGKIVGIDDISTDDSAKADCDTAGELTNELRKDISETNVDDEGNYDGILDIDDNEENNNEFEDVNFEKAAKEAVESFERDVQIADDAVSSEKGEWAASMIGEDDDQGSEFSFVDDVIDAGTFVEADRNSAIGMESPSFIAEKHWSSLKVVELKEELKKRGLKTSGSKTDLLSLLEESDLQELWSQAREAVKIAKANFDEEPTEEMLEELERQAREAEKIAQAIFDKEPTEEIPEELESGEFLDEPKPELDFSKMTISQLKEQCRKRALKVSGRKAELIERIENSITD